MSGSLKEQVGEQDWRRKKAKMDVERRGRAGKILKEEEEEDELFLGLIFFYFDFMK